MEGRCGAMGGVVRLWGREQYQLSRVIQIDCTDVSIAPAGLINRLLGAPPSTRGATEHKGRQKLKVCKNLFSFRYVNHTMAIESAITRWNKGRA